MDKFNKFVEKTSRLLDNIAGGVIVVTMALVVVNVILRSAFKSPIKGVYEYTGYLTAFAIAFSIAECAVKKAHIAVDFFMEKLSPKIQLAIDSVLRVMIVIFLAFSSIQVIDYGINVIKSGEVSATAHVSFYPFIFITAIGLIVLGLVELSRLIKGGEGK